MDEIEAQCEWYQPVGEPTQRYTFTIPPELANYMLMTTGSVYDMNPGYTGTETNDFNLAFWERGQGV